MTGTRQYEDNTTLHVQPCRTAAVVGYIMYVRVASPRYAGASCFYRSLSSVTPPYRIFLLCAAACRMCYDPAAQQQASPLAAACNSMRVWLLL